METVRTPATSKGHASHNGQQTDYQVAPDPMPKDAPGLRTKVKDSSPGITRMV